MTTCFPVFISVELPKILITYTPGCNAEASKIISCFREGILMWNCSAPFKSVAEIHAGPEKGISEQTEKKEAAGFGYMETGYFNGSDSAGLRFHGKMI